MIKIYFDDVLIDEDSYTALTNDYQLFTDNFYLGATASNTFKLSVAKTAVTTQPSEVKITDDTNTYYLIVDKINEEKNFYVYDLVDKLVLFNFNYNAKTLIDARTEDELTTTLSDILSDMCTQAEVTLDSTLTLINDIEVTWYDNTLLARDYLSFIAELQGGYAKILDNGKLTIAKHKTTSKATLQIDNCEDFLLGEKKTISRVVYDNGIVKYEYGDETANTLYINPNNVYITDTTVVSNIYNEVAGLEFYLIDTGKCQLDPSVRAGDIITFTDGVLSYPTIAGYSANYGGGYWLGNYSLNIESKQQEETQTIGIDSKIKSIKTEMDRTNASLKITADKTDDNESYISSIQLTPEAIRLSVSKVDELDEDINNPTTGLSKKYGDLEYDVYQLRNEIGDVTDITTQEQGSGELSFENINSSEPINITIRPTSAKDISYIYPSSALFPSSTLFPQARILRFHNTTTSEIFDYTLPGNLRYYDADNYDEFILDFATTTCKIIRKIDISASMVKTLKATPIEEIYDYPTISLTAGNYTVTMLGYPNAYMKIRLMSQNMYTSQFTTRVEVNSVVTQTANEINLEVAKKADKTEVISTINQTADEINLEVAKKVDKTGVISSINLTSEAATINAEKIKLEGLTTINNNFKVLLDGSIEANNGLFKGDVKVGATNLVDKSLGVLTNLYFPMIGTTALNWGGMIGYDEDGHKMELWCGVIIPPNFSIVSAKLFLKGSKTEWFDDLVSRGFAQTVNTKLYKGTNLHFKYVVASGSDYTNLSLVNTGALGSNGVTIGGANGSTHVVDIPTSFFNDQFNYFLLRSDGPQKMGDASYLTRVSSIAGIQIVGYYK